MITIHASGIHTLRQLRMLKDFTIAGQLWIPMLDAADEELSWAVSRMPLQVASREIMVPVSKLFSLCVAQFHKIDDGNLMSDWMDFLLEDEAVRLIHEIDEKLILGVESLSRDVKEVLKTLPYYKRYVCCIWNRNSRPIFLRLKVMESTINLFLVLNLCPLLCVCVPLLLLLLSLLVLFVFTVDSERSIDDDLLNLMDEVDLQAFLKEASEAIEDQDKLAAFIYDKATIAVERFLVRPIERTLYLLGGLCFLFAFLLRILTIHCIVSACSSLDMFRSIPFHSGLSAQDVYSCQTTGIVGWLGINL